MPKDHIILYGGSFNPPHFSHLLFVAALGGCFPEAEIWVAPTYAHAFGKPLMDYELRLRMLEAMFAPYRHVVVSTIERDLHRSTSYTVDVVRAILAQCPGVRVSVACCNGANMMCFARFPISSCSRAKGMTTPGRCRCRYCPGFRAPRYARLWLKIRMIRDLRR